MNAPKIIGPVGIGGFNYRNDVVVVQQLINQSIKAIFPRKLLPVDGRCHTSTIEAIKEFQRRVVRIQFPNGRVDPGGHTFQALAAYAAGGRHTMFPFEGTPFNSFYMMGLAQNMAAATINPTPYTSRDKAAVAAEKQAVELTNKKNGVPPKTDWEFGGWIVKKGESFYYTEPMQGTKRGETEIDNIGVPKGFTKVAGYHTHPDGGPWGEGFSGYPSGDVGWVLNHPGGPMVFYVGMTYSGNVRVYIPGVTKYSQYGITGDLIGNVYK